MGVALGVGAATTAMAATYTVSNLSDSGAGSLRQAVTDANAAPGADVITFGVTGTIALTTLIAVTDPLSINGPGASLLTITPPAGAYALTNTSQLTVSGVTVDGGSGGPAAVGSSGSLTLQSSVFSNNSGTDAGAVYFLYSTTVSILDCTFNNNTATGSSTGYAGAVVGGDGALNIVNSTFSGNQGHRAGAIFSIRNTFVMTNSTVSGNTGNDPAGGIVLYDLTVPGEIRNSTLSGNIATNGNSAGIAVRNISASSSALNLTSTIVANSTSNSGTADISIPGANVTINAVNSLIEDGAGAVNGTNTANLFSVDPLLGALQNNGGPTWTHALLPGSPAIDAGSNPLTLATDQRGAGFVRMVGSATDMGAYEVQAPPVPPPVPTVTSIPTLSEWGTLALAALLGGVTVFTRLGRRKRGG